MQFEINQVPRTIEGFTDSRWTNKTIYNHYSSPLEFMNDVVDHIDHKDVDRELIESGMEKYKRIMEKDITYDKIYEDVARQVKDKLITRGFTTAMLYSTVEFTSENTGVMSKQRAMLGKRDCFFKNPGIADGKLFHDIYINLSYAYSVQDSKITRNSYALYALTKELSRVLPMRVIIVNHVGTDTPTCYSYILKQFGQPIRPEEFLFFTSDSKRTFGWATYNLLNGGSHDNSTVGKPTGTVSIDQLNLDKVIDEVFLKVQAAKPGLFRMV